MHCVDGGDEQSCRPITDTPVSTPAPLSPPLSRLPSPPSVVCGGSCALCRRRQCVKQSADVLNASLDTEPAVWRQRCSGLTATTSGAVARSLARRSRHRHRHVGTAVYCVDGGDEWSSLPIACTPVSTPTPPCGGSGALCQRWRRAEQSADHWHASLDTDTAVAASQSSSFFTSISGLWRQRCRCVDGSDDRSSRPITHTPVSTPIPLALPLCRLASP